MSVQDPLFAVTRETSLHEQLDVTLLVRTGDVKAQGSALARVSQQVLHEAKPDVASLAGVNGVQLNEPYVRGVATEPLSEDDSWVVQSDRLFVMGDNRQNSTDSRSDQIGEICVGDVVGRAWVRYWPLNTVGILPTPTYANVPAASAAPSRSPRPSP